MVEHTMRDLHEMAYALQNFIGYNKLTLPEMTLTFETDRQRWEFIRTIMADPDWLLMPRQTDLMTNRPEFTINGVKIKLEVERPRG